ncbi:MAG: DNA recombination protein RmuC [Candidatus Pacebacteria bacterium]|nr:DNA recombination protein RmuC [Candidatus Paceibacterota bacterium]
MPTTLLVILIALVAIAIFLLIRINMKKSLEKGEDVGFKLLLEQMNELSRTVHDVNKTVDAKMTTQFTESQRLIKDITRELTEVKETGKQVISFADQLQNLQDILKNPKQRGILGEYYLETLLKNVMPPGSYQMQYKFPDETIVDAVVFVKDKIIPIDSKFSLENYNRIVEEKEPTRKKEFEKVFLNDLKNRILETSKYIQPNNGTMDFAFMFIPHEAIYYDLIVNKIGGNQDDDENLIQRAASKYKVIIVSPTSFLAYLQTVLQGLRALKIEDTAKDIIKRVDELGKHLKSYEDYHGKMGNALATTVNHYNASQKEFKKIDKDVLRVTGDALKIGEIALDRPEREEE